MLTTRASHLSRACTKTAVEYIAEQVMPKSNVDTMETGTIIHSLILENKLPADLVVLDYPDYRTKSAQADKAEAYAQNKIPVLKKEVAQYLDYDLIQVKALFKGYKTEVAMAMVYKRMAKITGHLDAWNGSHVKDLKVTNPQTFKDPVKEIYWRGYDIQLFLYMLMSKTQTASIVFFNLETGLFQEIDMHLNDIKESCMQRIEQVGFQNIMAYEAYKNGMRQLDSLAYYPR